MLIRVRTALYRAGILCPPGARASTYIESKGGA